MAALLFLRSSFSSPCHRENIENNSSKQNLMNVSCLEQLLREQRINTGIKRRRFCSIIVRMSVLDLHWCIYRNVAFGKAVVLETDLLFMTTLICEKKIRYLAHALL